MILNRMSAAKTNDVYTHLPRRSFTLEDPANCSQEEELACSGLEATVLCVIGDFMRKMPSEVARGVDLEIGSRVLS